LDALRASGATHAAEVARLAGLSRPTASQILRSLIDVGLVDEVVPVDGDPRRARSMFSAVPDLGVVLAIDIGARFVRAAVGDLNGLTLATVSRPVADPKLSNILTEMRAAVSEALSKSGFGLVQVLSVVVGSPGLVDSQTGNIAIAGTISELDGIPLGEIVAKEFNCTPLVENDVNLVTVAEHMFGAGKDVQDFAVLSVGSGIGAGLILGGKLHRGYRGAAGEIFYIPFGDPFDDSRSATDPSASSITKIAATLASNHPQSKLEAPYTSVAIFEAARYKDPLAIAVVAEVAERIALYIAAMTAVVDMELVVLSGGIGRQADVLLAAIQAVVARIVPFAPRIEVSALGENAILLGGLGLATNIARELVFKERSNGYQAAREQLESSQ